MYEIKFLCSHAAEGAPARRGGCTCETWRVYLRDVEGVPARREASKSKQFPSEVYVLRKRVNLSSESSQLFSDEAVNLIRMGKQVLKNKA